MLNGTRLAFDVLPALSVKVMLPVYDQPVNHNRPNDHVPDAVTVPV